MELPRRRQSIGLSTTAPTMLTMPGVAELVLSGDGLDERAMTSIATRLWIAVVELMRLESTGHC